MNYEESGFEYLSEDTPQNIHEEPTKNNVVLEEPTEFIKGLPEWDLEPPYEIVRRQQLWLILNVLVY